MTYAIVHCDKCSILFYICYDNNNKYILRMNAYVNIIYPAVCNPKIKPTEQSVLFKFLKHAYYVYVEL